MDYQYLDYQIQPILFIKFPIVGRLQQRDWTLVLIKRLKLCGFKVFHSQYLPRRPNTCSVMASPVESMMGEHRKPTYLEVILCMVKHNLENESLSCLRVVNVGLYGGCRTHLFFWTPLGRRRVVSHCFRYVLVLYVI